MSYQDFHGFTLHEASLNDRGGGGRRPRNDGDITYNINANPDILNVMTGQSDMHANIGRSPTDSRDWRHGNDRPSSSSTSRRPRVENVQQGSGRVYASSGSSTMIIRNGRRERSRSTSTSRFSGLDPSGLPKLRANTLNINHEGTLHSSTDFSTMDISIGAESLAMGSGSFPSSSTSHLWRQGVQSLAGISDDPYVVNVNEGSGILNVSSDYSLMNVRQASTAPVVSHSASNSAPGDSYGRHERRQHHQPQSHYYSQQHTYSQQHYRHHQHYYPQQHYESRQHYDPPYHYTVQDGDQQEVYYYPYMPTVYEVENQPPIVERF